MTWLTCVHGTFGYCSQCQLSGLYVGPVVAEPMKVDPPLVLVAEQTHNELKQEVEALKEEVKELKNLLYQVAEKHGPFPSVMVASGVRPKNGCPKCGSTNYTTEPYILSSEPPQSVHKCNDCKHPFRRTMGRL